MARTLHIWCVYVIIRDGSYGLLRRFIWYNALLIRNTRIIQKRIYAILGGTLGLHQPPSNHHKLSPSLQNIIMPPGKDPEWPRVVVMGPKGQSYEMPWQGGMPDARIPRFQQRCPPHPRALHEAESQPSVGVAACKADPAGVLSARMGEIADASAQSEEHAGKERHLHRTTASTSAAASTQSLDTCSKRAVTKVVWMQLLHNSSTHAPPSGLW